jgi:hypothetical protein
MSEQLNKILECELTFLLCYPVLVGTQLRVPEKGRLWKSDRGHLVNDYYFLCATPTPYYSYLAVLERHERAKRALLLDRRDRDRDRPPRHTCSSCHLANYEMARKKGFLFTIFLRRVFWESSSSYSTNHKPTDEKVSFSKENL